MAELTIDELKGFLLRAVGEDETIDLSGDILDTPLADLGFDSLAVIATTSALEQHFQVKLGDDDASGLDTPGDFLDVFNRRLTQAA
ncbi:act minimal PKS acyl carrier protein [Streptomyces luteogriseus]|uniref:acyl carrier protein n=1 Tax=Streptomyces luteogriseus TaxID=68233 RepID=UPI00278B1F7D|nr:acyl carrier protein [Streptomyces luteogriseus]MDQ0711666.1 act minimal PKS acyl carrier protein [Streptomyces luteogriseus]